ncbi:MAG: proton-conducting transporter membrane subunit [Leptospiraceae bacterium]|nr:proton-conducting transporter membrane subunit [Leptospiraceae bacterium]MCZ8347714.1 proton-conducting transporter membrane subunit [Leptospiraceae bacterium]
MIEFLPLLISGFISYFAVMIIWIFFPTHKLPKRWIWLSATTLFFLSLALSWFTENFAASWVFIEASTLFGALLISSSGTVKSSRIAWKFLVINSYGLGISFLGLILVSFSGGSDGSLNIYALKQVQFSTGPIVNLGLTLAIYGYTAKMGLWPNHFWVGDTYGESPTQVSSLIASLIPVTVALVLRELVAIDRIWNPSIFSARLLLPILGSATCLHSIWMLYQRNDIRRIAAKIALFHTGALAWIIWMEIPFSIFLYILVGTVLLKTLVFLTMGILRIEAGSKYLEQIFRLSEINKKVKILYFASLFFAFAFPVSPAFLTDFLIIKLSIQSKMYLNLLIPFLSLIFFSLLVSKVYNIWAIEDSKQIKYSEHKLINGRLAIVSILFLLIIGWGIYGIMNLELVGELYGI